MRDRIARLRDGAGRRPAARTCGPTTTHAPTEPSQAQPGRDPNAGVA